MNPEAVANEIRSRLAADDPLTLEMIWAEYAADLLGYLASMHGSAAKIRFRKFWSLLRGSGHPWPQPDC